MAELSGIRTSLFLILMLQFTATHGKYSVSELFVRDGDEVTLPCENKEKCDGTTWTFSGSGQTSTLFDLSEGKSDRVSVTENCSVVIKRVTVEDVGRYNCRQVNKFREQGDATTVCLSVVTMTEQKNRYEVTLNCSVSTYKQCSHTVQWQFGGNRTDSTSQHLCSASVTFPTSHLNQESRILTCIIRDPYSADVQQFTFIPQSSGEETGNGAEAGNVVRVGETDSPRVLRCIIVSVGLAALIISVVTVDVWTRTKGNKTQMEENTVYNDEDEGAVK